MDSPLKDDASRASTPKQNPQEPNRARCRRCKRTIVPEVTLDRRCCGRALGVMVCPRCLSLVGYGGAV
jgi:hypothetical protein